MFSSLNYSVYIYVCTTLVLFMCSTLVLFVCSTLIIFVCSTLVLFMCNTLVLFMCTTNSHLGVAERGWVADRGRRQSDKFFGSAFAYCSG